MWSEPPRAPKVSLWRLAVVADGKQPVLDGEPNAFLDQGFCNAGDAGAVGSLSHQFFEITDGRERQGNRNTVGFGFFCGHAKKLASIRCTEKYLFRVYFILLKTGIFASWRRIARHGRTSVPTGMAQNPNAAPMLFDRALLRARALRAAKLGPATFLLDRVAGDLPERLQAVVRK